MSAFFAALVTLWYPLEGWDWVWCDSIPVIGYTRTHFAAPPRQGPAMARLKVAKGRFALEMAGMGQQCSQSHSRS